MGITYNPFTPTILVSDGWPGYELLDCGAGRKLERYGEIIVSRPEEQALWKPAQPQSLWQSADARFENKRDEEDSSGRWYFQKKLPEKWPMEVEGIKFYARLTSFRHMGIFPEQISHWRWMAERIALANRPVRVLNLFAYTGIASLVAARAGAQVTHLDASPKAITWARENQSLSGLENAPIRWICDDALKFLAREVRRGNQYDMILLDPPKYGRGPKGETWNFFQNLPNALDLSVKLLSPDACGLVLTAYTIRASWLMLDRLMHQALAGRDGKIDSGELVICAQKNPDMALVTSLFSRWSSAG